MNQVIFKEFFSGSVAFFLVFANLAVAGSQPHLDLDVPGSELDSMLQKRAQSHRAVRAARPPSDAALEALLLLGRRNLQWISLLNQSRPVGQKLVLSSPETQVAYPVDAPSVSNRTLILDRLEAWKQAAPIEMTSVIFSADPLPSQLALDDQVISENARKLDRIYQSGSRWLLQLPYLEEYAAEAKYDIRAFYFLRQIQDLELRVSNWNLETPATQAQWRGYLIGLCFVGPSTLEQCAGELDQGISQSPILFLQKYWPAAQVLYDSFFEIQNPRAEAIWTDLAPNVLTLPFLNPELSGSPVGANAFIKDNIEDEWKLQNWNLRLRFDSLQAGAQQVYVDFKPGVTPHVNALGGAQITMDLNRPFDDYSNQWTIRHEFGHVLGFPDCYQEFYDEPNGVMISYQIDTSDLMCSRRGHLKQRHFDNLKKHYFKDSAQN